MIGSPTIYQVLLLGKTDTRSSHFKSFLLDRVAELGVDKAAVLFLDSVTAASRDRRLPAFGVFFGDSAVAVNSATIAELLSDSVVLAPVVTSLDLAAAELPPQLCHINAVEYSSQIVDRVVSLALETFRLLRAERRLFISYRRKDSQPFADRLYDALDSRGFDVFLDTRSVPPAADFQAELWHRMSDSDVVVLIDTPGFRASRWTTEELARANATNVQILHLLWPGQTEDASSSFSHFMKLDASHFAAADIGRGETVTVNALSDIYSAAERLRARAVAARHRYLVDSFCDAARDFGMNPSLHPERWIEIKRATGRTLAVVPAIGVPTSDRLNAIFDAVADKKTNLRDLWVIYDNRGLLTEWLSHLEWLNTHLPVRVVQMAAVPKLLEGLP